MRKLVDYKSLIVGCVLYTLSGIMIKYIACVSVKIGDHLDVVYDRIPNSGMEVAIAFFLMFFLYSGTFIITFWGIFFHKTNQEIIGIFKLSFSSSWRPVLIS